MNFVHIYVSLPFVSNPIAPETKHEMILKEKKQWNNWATEHGSKKNLVGGHCKSKVVKGQYYHWTVTVSRNYVDPDADVARMPWCWHGESQLHALVGSVPTHGIPTTRYQARGWTRRSWIWTAGTEDPPPGSLFHVHLWEEPSQGDSGDAKPERRDYLILLHA